MKAVPPSIKEGALGVGASEIQAVFHHVVPVAIPGMLTGTIIGMARALGESAPLLVIGMVAFIVDIPQSVTDPATALPIPCPSGPVVVSTPGVTSHSGCPGVFEPSFRKFLSSSKGKS